MQTVGRASVALCFLAIPTSVNGQVTSRPSVPTTVPGVVIDHSPQSSGLYIGSPGLAILPDGTYLASHDFFGPSSNEKECATTVVFRSGDRGLTWRRIARLQCLFWASLFTHGGAAWLLGTEKHHGRVVIRRSTNEGVTWTEPRDAGTGLLTPDGLYHTAPVPVVVHAGRVWRAIEEASGGTRWGERYRAGMMSAPADADLLRAENWTFSNFLARDAGWLGGAFGGWLEGNAVATRDGRVVNVLRVEVPRCPERAAMVEISSDGRTARFDPATGFVELPGGAKKFTIRFDGRSGLYWAIVTIAAERHCDAGRPGGIRNTLALTCSPDLRRWSVRATLLYHPDVVRHGFQYVDWLFEGEDIVAVCRTAYDDGQGGARNNHDANYLTFHRIRGFRELRGGEIDSAPSP